MPLAVAVQMDPIERLVLAGDSTFALLLEAEARGHDIFSYQPDALAYRDGKLSARGRPLSAHSSIAGESFSTGEETLEDLGRFDVLLMRQDPPFDMSYISATHLLEHIHPKTLVVNDPFHVRNAPEKLFVNAFAAFMPATLITRDAAQMRAFRAEFGDVIVKPLYGNGGAGVFRLGGHDENFSALIELFQSMNREPFIVQEYRPEVRKGDKRIILVDGEVAGAINRVPAQGDTRSNMHVGGRPEPTELTARDREICAALGPVLRERGLIFVGIDVIGDYLTEINVTSPTGIREVKRFGGADIAGLVWDAIEARVAR
jgi:glutathione synthase